MQEGDHNHLYDLGSTVPAERTHLQSH
jgi:hypothetical protein